MADTEPPRKRPPRRSNTTAKTSESAPDEGKQPARNRTGSASSATKLVRKGRKPTAGAKLRREMAWPKMDHAAELLITQAARLADRLEVIDRLLSGEAAAWLAVKIDGQVAQVVVTDVVREERQLSEVLRKLIMEIQRLRPEEPGEKGAAGQKTDPVVRIVTEHYGGRKRA